MQLHLKECNQLIKDINAGVFESTGIAIEKLRLSINAVNLAKAALLGEASLLGDIREVKIITPDDKRKEAEEFLSAISEALESRKKDIDDNEAKFSENYMHKVVAKVKTDEVKPSI